MHIIRVMRAIITCTIWKSEGLWMNHTETSVVQGKIGDFLLLGKKVLQLKLVLNTCPEFLIIKIFSSKKKKHKFFIWAGSILVRKSLELYT